MLSGTSFPLLSVGASFQVFWICSFIFQESPPTRCLSLPDMWTTGLVLPLFLVQFVFVVSLLSWWIDGHMALILSIGGTFNLLDVLQAHFLH